MKRSVKYLLSALIALLLLSCSREVKPAPVVKPQPEPEEHRSYTIMFYGSGGGLDEFFESMIRTITEVSGLSQNRYINVVGQMKWSKGYVSSNSLGNGGVSRFKYNHRTNEVQYSRYKGPEFRIDEAENLAEFIEWARQEAPADEYILLFGGHGNGYHPSFDGVTRGILRDDMYTAYLGVGDLREAFEMSDMRFKLILMESCLMNTIEYATELAPYADYYYASSHVVAVTNSELPCFVEGLILNYEEEDAVLKAGMYGIDELYDALDVWEEELSLDASITQCSSIDALNSEVCNFVDIVVGFYDKEAVIGEEAMMQEYGFTTKNIDEALSNSYHFLSSALDPQRVEWYRRAYTYDIVSVVNNVASATNLPELKKSALKVEQAASEALIHQRTCSCDAVYYSVAVVNSSEWSSLGFDEAGYEALAFDMATGWSRLLQRNNATYPH